jgi:hypothetical protein
VRSVKNKDAFLKAVRAAVVHFKANRSKFPVLHISAHGCKTAIGSSPTDFATWDELGAAIGTDLSDRLILCMSACEGLRSWGMALMESRPHYLVLIGTEEKPFREDTKTGFPAFFRSMAQGKDLERALLDLKAASKHPYFMGVPGQDVKQFRLQVIGAKTLEEAHAVREKFGLPSLRHIEFSPVYPFKRITQAG